MFNVEWMLTKCADFYQEVLETSEDETYTQFLFEESVYLCKAGRSNTLLKMWISKIAKEEEIKCHGYIRNYLDSNTDVSGFTLEQLLELTRDHSLFLLYVHDKVVKGGAELDSRYRLLLHNMDMVGCMDIYQDTVTELFYYLLLDE